MANILENQNPITSITIPGMKWVPISDIQETKWKVTIPQEVQPITTFAIGENIFSNLTIPSQTESGSSSVGGITNIMEAIVAISNAFDNFSFYTGDINLSRRDSYGLFGGIRKTTTAYGNSPRFGYQIGEFKHQAYIKVRSSGIAMPNSGRLNWYNFDTVSSIEYATNSKMKKLYLSHGKVVGIRIEYESLYYVKLFEFLNSPDTNFSPSGTLKVYTMEKNVYKERSFDMSGLQITETGELIFDTTTFPEIAKIKEGDFFTVDVPWILEDYSLLYEYGLNKVTGFYETDEQKYKAFYKESEIMTVLGFWFPLEKELIFYADDGTTVESKETATLWTLYTDLPSSMFVLPKTPAQEKFSGENSDVYSFQDGLNILLKKNDTTARIVLFGASGELQNFYSPTLTGEYIKANNYYFQINAHPRNDTIEIKLESVNGSTTNAVINFSDIVRDNNDVGVEVIQQKFWFTHELYYGYPNSHFLWEGDITLLQINDYKEEDTTVYENQKITNTKTISVAKALDGGIQNQTKTITLNSPKIKVATTVTEVFENKTTRIKLWAEDVRETYLDQYEQSATGCNYMTEKFYKKMDLKQDSSFSTTTINFFKKYQNWYFHCNKTNANYKILDAFFDKKPKTTSFYGNVDVEISLVLEGDLSSQISIGNSGFLFTGEPQKTISGNYGEMSVNINMSPSLDISNQYSALMYGNYYSGSYTLSNPANEFNINSFSYGGLTVNGRSLPDIYIGTRNINLCLSSCIERVGKSFIYYVFFKSIENENNLFVKRGSYGWTKNIQEKVVFSGNYKEISSDEVQSLYQNKTLYKKSYIVGMIYSVDIKNGIYCLANSINNDLYKNRLSKYHSFTIHNGSLIDTNLTNVYKLNQQCKEKLIYYPFEFISYTQSNADNNQEYFINVDCFIKFTGSNTGENIELFYSDDYDGKALVRKIINGESFNISGLKSNENKLQKLQCVENWQLFNDTTSLYAFINYSNSLYLIYGKLTPSKWYIRGLNREDDKQFNSSKPSVWIVKSDSSANQWGSAWVSGQDVDKAPIPLMLLYDFDLKSSLIEEDNHTCYLFGYAYDKNKGPGTSSTYSNNLFLGVYCIDTLNITTAFSTGTNMFVGVDQDQQNNVWNIIFPSLKGQTSRYSNFVKKDNQYGIFKEEFGQQLLENYNNAIDNIDHTGEGNQFFVSILSQQDAVFGIDSIASYIDQSGKIAIFVTVKKYTYKNKKDVEHVVSGIVSLVSTNSGKFWDFEKDNDGEVVIYGDKNNTFQYCKDNFLFMFDTSENQLIVKNLSQSNTSLYHIVATNVEPQSITASINDIGEIYVYYFGRDGTISASKSNDNGEKWTKVTNW